jgi:hypothetical protein
MVDRNFFLEWAFFAIPVTKYILREYEFVPEKVVTTTVLKPLVIRPDKKGEAKG